jgi:hypothetical protein
MKGGNIEYRENDVKSPAVCIRDFQTPPLSAKEVDFVHRQLKAMAFQSTIEFPYLDFVFSGIAEKHLRHNTLPLIITVILLRVDGSVE